MLASTPSAPPTMPGGHGSRSSSTAQVEDVRRTLDDRLPVGFMGRPVRFFRWQTDRVEHHVEVTTVGAWLEAQLGSDPRDGITTADWLATPQQLLLQVTAGAVFRDDRAS